MARDLGETVIVEESGGSVGHGIVHTLVAIIIADLSIIDLVER